MLYKEIIVVCFQIHTKHINTVSGQNVELLNVKLVVHIVTTGVQRVKHLLQFRFLATSQLKTNTLRQRHAVSQHIGPYSSTAVRTWNLSQSSSTYSLYCLLCLSRCPSVQKDKRVCIAFEIEVIRSIAFRHFKFYQNLSKWHPGCPGRNVPDFGRMFLKFKYTDLTKNTYIRSWTFTEIMAREKCSLLAGPRTVPVSWQLLCMLRRWVWYHMTAIQLTLAINCICTSFRVMT